MSYQDIPLPTNEKSKPVYLLALLEEDLKYFHEKAKETVFDKDRLHENAIYRGSISATETSIHLIKEVFSLQ